MPKALQGIRVVEFTFVAAGPYAGLLLGFMGAEVIRVESAKRIDWSRVRGTVRGDPVADLNSSPSFNDFNLNKLSVRLNLKTPRGVELAKELVKISDVVIDNYAPGVMKKLGLDYDGLKAVKPDIIVISLTGFGTTGPEARYRAYGPTIAALGGLSHLTGYVDGVPTELRIAVDLTNGTTAAFAILTALIHRQKTGVGQYIDFSFLENMGGFMGEALMDYTMNGRVQCSKGNLHDVMAPHNCYRCRGEDRWVSIAVATDEEWQALCNAMGNPDLAKEEKFSDALSRWKNQAELDKRIEEWTVHYDAYEVMKILQNAGVAAVPSFNNQDLFTDPHLNERGVWTSVQHPKTGKQVALNPPWKLSATPAEVYRPAPLFGEHNSYVLGELLGISKEEQEKLVKEEVIH